VAVQSVLDQEMAIFGGGIGSREDFVDRVRAHVSRLKRRPPVPAASALSERVGAAELALASVAERGADERPRGVADA
jgi:hypothetical protein